MPTAVDFDRAAQIFASVEEGLVGLLVPVQESLSAVVGGALRVAVDQAIDASDLQAQYCRRRLADVVELCVARAATIRALEDIHRTYEADYLRYLDEAERWAQTANAVRAGAIDLPLGPRPRPPNPPERLPDWAELVL